MKLIERESFIKNTRKRCDIKFKDRLNRDLYLEVKEFIDDSAIQQINHYRNLTSDPTSRFMLVANNALNVHYEKQLTELNIEYKCINKDRIIVKADTIVEVQKGKSKFKSKENVLIKLNKQRQIAEDICEYVSSNLHAINEPILCNISDGIMYQLVERNEKFLSLSTVGNRLLFHFPNGKRDEIYREFKKTIPEIYCYMDTHLDKLDKEQNQIDIKLKDIKFFDYVKLLIDEAYEISLNNR